MGEKKRKWSLVMSGLKNSEEHSASAPWRPVACEYVCAQTLHIKITRHVNVSCKLTKRRDELEDEANRTNPTAPDNRVNNVMRMRQGSSQAPDACCLPPAPSHPVPLSWLVQLSSVWLASWVGAKRYTFSVNAFTFNGLMSASLITIFTWE